ncbi:MAG: M23 family metallopeptidase [Lachnospiraceae bacterium]|nr:M23 family metallopeptidase [Lachnospiraceae bacterium]
MIDSNRNHRKSGNHNLNVNKNLDINLNKRSGLRKEKIIMLSASLFVLTALTMTGVYVKEKNKVENDEYVVDLSAIEKQVPDKVEEIADAAKTAEQANDMDVDPLYQEANSANVENHVNDLEGTLQIPGVGSVQSEVKKGIDRSIQEETKGQNGETETENTENQSDEANALTSSDAIAASSAKKNTRQYTFSSSDSLQWPIVGNVLINYSMDKTVYFKTLEQYKYNPAIVIEAAVGEPITVACSGEVIAVNQDAELGNTVVMNIGDGYEVTYGQLANVQVAVGQNLESGELLGEVAEPSKYYSVEGSNVYFKLTKDGVPVNPMGQLN